MPVNKTSKAKVAKAVKKIVPKTYNKPKVAPVRTKSRSKAKPKAVSRVVSKVKVNQLKGGSITKAISKAKNLQLKPCIPPVGMKGTTKNTNVLVPRTGRAPVCFASEQGHRDSMEDTYQIMHFTIGKKQGTFYGVFDGHGGKDVSFQLVATTGGLFPYLRNALAKYPNQPVSKVLKLAFLEYDRKLFDKKLKSGSTAIVVLRYDDNLYIINVGDSRAMVFSDNDVVFKTSDDHKPWKPIERTRIYKAGHYVNPFKIYDIKTKKSYDYGDVYHSKETGEYQLYLNGNWEDISREQFSQIKSLNSDIDTHRVCNSLALSRAFGDFYLKVDKEGKYLGLTAAISPEPDIDVIPLRPLKGRTMYVFLASDGFWDVSKVTPNFKDQLKTNPDPMNMCKELVDGAIAKGSTDNTTVVFDKFMV